MLAAPLLLVVSFATEGTAAIIGAMTQMDWVSAGAVLFQAYAATLFCFGMWSMLIEKYPASIVAPYTLLVPVIGMLAAAALLGEGLQWWKIAAGMLVFAGLVLNQFAAPNSTRVG